ncbi:uncharacterized protein LOC112567791 isoform X2 [Pomacea canaliculata]|uniref:uncharacterized protein LOC112567791 isoform X2 n=1 Tax=Pomacea canaliculata TaxID=400727 RepID=UPI000D73D457|nr:uncharacterized protein LOC112567791 isoform X2 [Pomacea canaliculata]
MMQGKSERQDIPPQKQYVMKSKTESASGQRLSAARPVQGLVLPSGPSFDPEDEEDLKKEISYQEQLKSRISEAQRVAEETTVPRLSLWDGDSEDFMQDSLDVPEDIEIDSERHKYHRDSVDIYHHQQRQPPQNIHNMEWGNPPAPPPAVVPHSDFSAQPSQPNPSPQAFSHNSLALNFDTREGYVGARFSNAYEQPQASNRDPVMPQRRPQYYPEEELAHQHAHFSHGYAPLKQQQQSSQFRQLPHPQSQQESYYAPQQLQDRHHQQHSQQQNAYYLQEQEQYLSDMDPAFQGQHPRVVGTGHYMDRGGPPHLGYVAPQAEVHDGYYMTETQSYGSGRGNGHQNQSNLEGGGVYGNSAKFVDQNSYEAEDEVPQLNAEHEGSIPLDMSKPPKPSYDYINNNKIDYGRAPRRTYKKIHDVKKDEKEKLADIFITKSKKKSSDSQLSSRDNSLNRYPAIAEHPGQKMASDAEHLWAQRSATLAQTRLPGRKKQLSNTSLMSIKSQQMNLSNSSAISSRSQIDPVHLPLRRPLELKPVHQEVITEDGQRISVDVNLRLISPTAQGEREQLGHENVASSRHSGPIGEPRQRWPGQPYPADNALSTGQQPYAFQNENEYQHGRYSADDAFASKKHGGLASGYLSDSHHDYNGGHTVNPFPKIPPIPIGSDDGAPRSAPVLSEGSYMQTYLREKEKMEKGEKPWYRVYSLQDYKRMQKEVCLGTLGPDLDSETFKEKREKMLRQNEYARSVKEKNSKERIHRKPPAVPKPKEQDDIISRRTLAIEYAKNVPKPTVKPKPTPYNSYNLASQLSPIAKNSGRGQQQNSFPEPSVEMLDLERLHQRHEEDKRSAEQIRQKAQGIW